MRAVCGTDGRWNPDPATLVCTGEPAFMYTASGLLALYPGRVGGEKRPGIYRLRMHDHSQKTWEFVYAWKLSVNSICIRPIYFRIIERCSCLPIEFTFNFMKSKG